MTESLVQTGNFNKTLRKKKNKRVSLSRKNENTHIHSHSVGGGREHAAREGRKEGRHVGQRASPAFS